MKKFLLTLSIATLLIGNVEARTHRHHRIKHHVTPTFSAKSYLVADAEGVILKEQAGDIVRPIASISKLMVALLATEQDLNEILPIPVKREVRSGIPKNVHTLKRKELLALALIKSDNFAAQILCINLPNCVVAMNEKAQALGMTDTYYREPTGLDRANVSTAHDLLKLLVVASTNAIINELSSKPTDEITLVHKRSIKFHNTNPLTSRYNVILSKTGFTNPAGGCIVMIIDSEKGKRIFVILGSKNTRTRIPDMVKLIKES